METTDALTTNGSTSDGNERHSLQTYVSDMLALERHIAQPIARQLGLQDTQRYQDASNLISRIQSTSQGHIAALESRLRALGGHEAHPLKAAWASLLGAGAATISGARKTKVSKNLRDDYTALSLATIGYTMLYTTTMGLGDTTTAELAKRHLADYAQIVMTINQVIPEVVLAELQIDGENVQAGAGDLIRQTTNEIWKSPSGTVNRG